MSRVRSRVPSLTAHLLVVTLAGCSATPPPAAPSAGTEQPASNESPTSLAATSSDAAWLERDKKVLDLEGVGSLDELKAAFTAERFEGVTHLKLSGLAFGEELASFVAESPLTGKLLALDISDNDLGTAGAERLLSTQALASLSELDLGGNDIGDAGAEALAHSDDFALKSLNLGGNSIGPEGVKALVSAKNLGALTSLDLSMNPIEATGAEALANAGFDSLKMLFLLGCDVGTQGARAISKSESLASLNVLALSGNAVGNDGASALAQSPHLTALALLDLSANGIGEKGALALAESKTLSSLTSLELYGNELGKSAEAKLKQRYADRLKL